MMFDKSELELLLSKSPTIKGVRHKVDALIKEGYNTHHSNRQKPSMQWRGAREKHTQKSCCMEKAWQELGFEITTKKSSESGLRRHHGFCQRVTY